MENISKVLESDQLNYHHKKNRLAFEAENLIESINLEDKTKEYFEKSILCDLKEGRAPYRPRYILPDYEKYFSKGSEYLKIKPPKDMYEAVNALLILYKYVPSITGSPVYLGQIDNLLEPYVNTVSDYEVIKLLKMLIINVDRCHPNGFVHLNIGPKDTKVGRVLLELDRNLKDTITNVSLKISKNTPKSFIKEGIKTALEIGKPYFINDEVLKLNYNGEYGVASCYNILPIGGGSHTIVRIDLSNASKISRNYNNFMEEVLPDSIDSMCETINKRATYLVEKSKFFESSFLVKESLISLEKFTSMGAVFGLYECVENLTNGLKLGKDQEANKMGEAIIKKVKSLLNIHDGAYCEGTNGKITLHAQSGLESDIDSSPGVRIKIGEETTLYSQIKTAGKLQKYFNSGVSEIFTLDKTANTNIDGVEKIIDGAFKSGMTAFAINSNESEFIRITGYLAKKSDIKKVENNEDVLDDSAILAYKTIKNLNIINRKIRDISED